MNKRARARELAEKYNDESWFEKLYDEAKRGEAEIPWADLKPNPHLVNWIENSSWKGKTAIKIGCGLGDDAEYLSKLGYNVTAFDISETAIQWCKERFPNSKVDYHIADLFHLPCDSKYDLVLESYTLQVFPPDKRLIAIKKIASLVSDILLVICRGRDADDPVGKLPWPLTKEEIYLFEKMGLKVIKFEDFIDDELPPVRRFRVEMVKD